MAIHPGETVQETLEFLGMLQADLATRTDLSEKTISLIVNGLQPVTPESALKFERVLGLSRELLLSMQAYYDADVFRLSEHERLEKETNLLSNYECYSELANLGYVEKTRNPLKKVEELLSFFGLNSLEAVPSVFPVAFRKSQSSVIRDESLASWLRIGVIESQKREVAPFSKSILRENLVKMRELTRESVDVYSNALIQLCAEAGVVLIYTPHLKKTCVNGSSRWLTPNKALVQLSLYHAYADIFWFTLFHELGHVLNHSKKEIFIAFENGSAEKVSKLEEEADLFAQKVLIPQERESDYQELKKHLSPSNLKEQVTKFSESIGVDAGIVAGRIGREMGAWRHVASLRKRLRFTSN